MKTLTATLLSACMRLATMGAMTVLAAGLLLAGAAQALKTDPALDKVTLLLANYDKETALNKQMKVQAQSTVIIFKGKTEVARDSGSVEPAQLKAVLSRGL